MELPSEIIKLVLKSVSQSTMIRRNKQWFEDTYINGSIKNHIERKIGPLVPLEIGKIYTFRYDPLYADELAFYDNMPMNLILGFIKVDGNKRENPFGINLSFIPPKIRLKILDKITRTFRRRFINQNVKLIRTGRFSSLRTIPMTYKFAKGLLANSGFEFAIRSYRYDRFESKPMIITYEDWWKTATFGSQDIQKMNKQAIYYRYKKKLNDDYRIGQKDKSVKLPKIKVKDALKSLEDNE